MTLLAAREATGGYRGAFSVREISLEADAGRCLAVIGPNGAGKSTLLRVLAGILPISAGTVLLAGRPLERWRRREVARQVTLVPQSVSFAFPLPVQEVVAQGRAPHLGPWRPPTASDHAAVQRAMAAVGLEEKARVSVFHLSGGERQRVVLARALAAEPRILLLDEPASSLDLLHQKTLADAVRQRLEAGVGVVVVAHDLNLALALADEVLVLQRGRVVARGKPPAVISPELLREVFGVEAEFIPRPDGSRAVLPPLR